MSSRGGTTALAAGVVAFVALVLVLGRAPHQPSGPPSSSYATTPDGLAAYASLLERAGHDVRRLRANLDDRAPARGEVVILVDGRPLTGDEQDALRKFIDNGGRVVLGGTASTALPGQRASRVPDGSFLRNRELAIAGNAARSLALAGPPSQRVAFVESVHGYHEQRGLRALPDGVQLCLALLGAAALAFLICRGRRLGPPEPQERELPPPRRAHVEALAAALARTSDRDTLIPTTPEEPT